MAAAAKPTTKGGAWVAIFWLAIGLMIAVPEVAAALVPLGVIGFVIWALVRGNATKPGVTQKMVRRAQDAVAEMRRRAAASDAASDVVSVQSAPPPSSSEIALQYFPPLADTGENFDFARGGMEARAHIEDVRYDNDGIFEIDIRVVPRSATDYRTTLVTAVPVDRMAEVKRGGTLRLRIDPARPGGPIFVM